MNWKTIGLILLIAVGAAGAATIAGTPLTQNDDGVVLNQPGGPQATLTGDVTIYNDSGGLSSSEIQLNTSEGSATFYATSDASATISAFDLEGTWTNTTALDVSSGMVINPADKERLLVSGDAETLDWRNYAVDDGNVDIVISASSGSSTLTLYNLPASTTVSAVDKATGGTIDVANTDSSGEASFDVQHSTRYIVLQSGDQSDSPSQSNPTPTGDLNQNPDEVQIDVADADFVAGDSVDVTFSFDGTQEYSTTISQNRTVTTSIPEDALTGGQHDWTVETSDSLGNTVTQTYSYTVPSNLTILDEETHELINNSTVKIQYYTRDLVVEKSTTTGKVDFTGAPIDEEFVVFGKTEGYHDRRIIVDSLYDQSTIYLLNESTEATDVEFQLRDLSGNFKGSDTKLMIQKAVNETNQSTYRTIAGDYFGADGSFPVMLERDQRYLLTIKNADGDERDLGFWQATDPEAGIRTLTVGEVRPPPVPDDKGYIAQVQTNEVGNDTYILFNYNDTYEEVSNFQLRVYERGDPSNEIYSDTNFNPGSTYHKNISVPSNSNVSTWLVNWSAERDGVTIGSTTPVQVGEMKISDFPLGAPWPGTLGFIVILLIPTLGGGRYAPEGAVATVAVAGMLMATSIVTIEPTFWVLAALVAASMVGVKYWGGP